MFINKNQVFIKIFNRQKKPPNEGGENEESFLGRYLAKPNCSFSNALKSLEPEPT
jgi:hypothetical protein